METTLINGDCLVEMKKIPDKSIDMILADLPYGTTACKWDVVIPFEPLWEQYKRIIKPNGVIVLTASQPFTSALVMSNPKMFKYSMVWIKPNGTSPFKAKYMPMTRHEDVLVFSSGRATYNPQMETGKAYKWNSQRSGGEASSITQSRQTPIDNKGTRYPTGLLHFKQERGLHPTQKPVALFEYLIKTYTNEGDIVLDNVAGSGTTGVACKNLNRNFILIEQDEKYCDIIKERVGCDIIKLLVN